MKPKIVKKYLLAFDEINNILSGEKTATEYVDLVESLMILGYREGMKATIDELDLYEDISEDLVQPNTGRLQGELYKRYDGKDFRQRVQEHALKGEYERITELAKNEYHRMYETGTFDMANMVDASGISVSKRWVTMMDDKVRDTHNYIHGDVVPLDEKFYTYDGDSAYMPGGFDLPENNINCRCILTYSRS